MLPLPVLMPWLATTSRRRNELSLRQPSVRRASATNHEIAAGVLGFVKRGVGTGNQVVGLVIDAIGGDAEAARLLTDLLEVVVGNGGAHFFGEAAGTSQVGMR